MSQQITIVTPENVKITYRMAGIGSRFLAVLADTLIQVFAIAVILIIFLLIPSFTEFFQAVSFGKNWVIAAVVLSIFLVNSGYFIFFETIWNGRTPGKKSVGIRVLRDGGFPVDFNSVFIRNIMRAVDILPVFYGIGGLVSFFNPQYKRLGDMAAGTIVVREREEEQQPEIVSYKVQVKDYSVINPAFISLNLLPRQALEVAKYFLERRYKLEMAVRDAKSKEIAEIIIKHLKLAHDLDKINKDPERFLQEIVDYYEKQIDAQI